MIAALVIAGGFLFFVGLVVGHWLALPPEPQPREPWIQIEIPKECANNDARYSAGRKHDVHRA